MIYVGSVVEAAASCSGQLLDPSLKLFIFLFDTGKLSLILLDVLNELSFVLILLFDLRV
jgi:hypothetical protein